MCDVGQRDAARGGGPTWRRCGPAWRCDEGRRGAAHRGGDPAVWLGGGAERRSSDTRGEILGGFLAVKTLGEDQTRRKFGARLQDRINLFRVYGMCWRGFFAPSFSK